MKKYLKWIIVLVVIGIIGGAGAWWYTFHKPALNVFDEKPCCSVVATELIKQYNENETLADSIYNGKVISVSGIIKSINKPESRVEISLEDEMMGVTCLIDSSYVGQQIDKINKLQIGQTVKIKGKCNGFLMDVKIDNCVIEE